MTGKQCFEMTEQLRNHPKLVRTLHIVNWAASLIIGITYCVFIFLEFYFGIPAFLRAVMVPLSGFLTLSAVRSLIDRPRPYEKFDISPVLNKKTKGKSFPSRHVFSAYMIAFTLIYAADIPALGLCMLILATILAVIRVASGVHFISDVIAGAAWAAVFAIIGYII